MVSNKCRFCEHDNPEGAKFCTECGGCLHLLPCPSCGAVTDVSATTCYQCQAQLPWAQSAEPAVPVAAAAAPRPRWQPRALAGVALLVVVAALAYYGYRHRVAPDVSQPTTAAGALRGNSDAVEAPAAKAAIAPPLARSPAIKADGAGERASSTPCTAEAAALGTCSPQSVPQTAAEPPTAARDAPAQVGDARKAAAPPRPEGCAEAVAALGLCGAVLPPVPAVTHTKE